MPLRQGYDEVSLDASQAASVSEWQARASVVDGRVTIEFIGADCPHCRADSKPRPWSRSVIRTGAFGLQPGSVETGSERYPVTCGCSEQHAGRSPAIPGGCGRSWSVEFTWSFDGKAATVGQLSAGPPPTRGDLGFAAAVNDLKKNELAGVRAQAAGWSKVLAGLTGLLGASQLLAGPTFAGKLASGWSDVVGILLVVAVVLAAVSAVASGAASLGRPDVIALTNSRDAGGVGAMLEHITDDLVARTRRPLVVAAWTAAAAFLTAIAVGVLLWWGPAAKARDTPPVCVAASSGIVKLKSLPTVTSGTLTVVSCQ